VARVLACAFAALAVCASASAAPSFQPAAHRSPPQVPNLGTTPKPLRVVSIVDSSYPNAADLVAFGQALPVSTWLAQVSAAWQIPGTAVAVPVITVDDLPSLVTASHSVGVYQDYVFRKARQAGVQQDPAHQTTYVLYIPCANHHSMDSFGCTSHHPHFNPSRPKPNGNGTQAVLFSPGDSLAVVLGAQNKPLDANTGVATHELAEAATDTHGVGQWKLHSNSANTPYVDASPWVRSSGTIEVADMAEGTAWYEASPSEKVFRYQRIYSNAASAAGGDPDVPASPNPYYGVSTSKDWYSVAGNKKHANMDVTAWSAKKIDKWSLEAKVVRWLDQSSGAASPCTLAKTSWSVSNGKNVNVMVDIGSVSGKSWCTVELTSSKPVAKGDTRHTWWAGLIIG
jgi:hypothetical protein